MGEAYSAVSPRHRALEAAGSAALTRPTAYVYLHQPSPLSVTLSRLTTGGPPMAPIKHFAAPAGLTTPPLSFAVRTGDLLFVSGIPGFDADGAIPDSFDAQFGFVVRNIKRVLDEAGATFRDLVKVNVLLTRASDVGPMKALYASPFGPAPYPSRTTCVVHALPNPAMLIEIECVASLAGR